MKTKLNIISLFTLASCAFVHHVNAATVITLTATAATEMSTAQRDNYAISGPAFTASASARGGVGPSIGFGIPVGSPLSFSYVMNGSYVSNSDFNPQLRGFVDTPETGFVPILLDGFATTGFGSGLVPATGDLVIPVTLVGSFTGCVGLFPASGGCDPASPYSFFLPVNLPGQITLSLFHDFATNTVSFRLSENKLEAAAVATPEPSTFAFFLVGIAGFGFARRFVSWRRFCPNIFKHMAGTLAQWCAST